MKAELNEDEQNILFSSENESALKRHQSRVLKNHKFYENPSELCWKNVAVEILAKLKARNEQKINLRYKNKPKSEKDAGVVKMVDEAADNKEKAVTCAKRKRISSPSKSDASSPLCGVGVAVVSRNEPKAVPPLPSIQSP